MDPRDPAVRKWLKKTALAPANPLTVRIAALSRLALAPPESDTFEVAEALAQGAPVSAGDRLLQENALATLSRLSLPEAKTAFAQARSSSVPSTRDAAAALALAQGGH